MDLPPSPSPGSDRRADAAARRARIRQRQILNMLQQYGPGYHRVTGDGCRYVAEIAHATPEEAAWLRAFVAEHPGNLAQQHPARTFTQWRQLRHSQGEQAWQAACAAHAAADWVTCLDRCDDAAVYGHLSLDTWQRIHSDVYGYLTGPASAPSPAAGSS